MKFRPEQIAIALLSPAAIWLVAQDGTAGKWGFVVGLASQPFWIFATWNARQWGMFGVSVAYTFSWVTGILNKFF